jgi:hypothetical protein
MSFTGLWLLQCESAFLFRVSHSNCTHHKLDPLRTAIAMLPSVAST